MEKAQFDLDWNLDPDSDGLKNYEENNLGTSPLDADTDNDGVKDLEEVKVGKDPNDTQGGKETLRSQYYAYASSLLGWENYQTLNWDTLYADINGNQFLGKALDGEVVNLALSTGAIPQQTFSLLAQSPYLQNLKDNGEIDVQGMKEYSSSIVDKYRQSEEEIEKEDLSLEM